MEASQQKQPHRTGRWRLILVAALVVDTTDVGDFTNQRVAGRSRGRSAFVVVTARSGYKCECKQERNECALLAKP